MVMPGGGDPTAELAVALAGLAVGAFVGLDKIIPEFRSSRYLDIENVTYRDVIKYFRDERPNDFRIESGALLRRPDAGRIILYQVFLDGKDEILSDDTGVPFGRAVRARTIDDELNTRFGRTDVIIFR